MMAIDRDRMFQGIPIKFTVSCPRCKDETTVKTSIYTWHHSTIFMCPCGQELGIKLDMQMTQTVYTAQNVNTPKPTEELTG